MGFAKPYKEKEFVCRQCGAFLDSDELEKGCCPNCKTDEYVFMNDINDE